MSTELEDLDALLKAPGWRRLAQHAEQEWESKFASLVTVAVGELDNMLALQKLRQVMVAKEAVQAILRWPKERLDQLHRQEQSNKTEMSVTFSRRGPL